MERIKQVIIFGVKILCGYSLGIATAILLTPAELELAGRNLLSAYILYSTFGFFFFVFIPTSIYLTDWSISRVAGYVISLLPVLVLVSYFHSQFRRIRKYAMILIGFSLGFVGTYGIYFAATASI